MGTIRLVVQGDDFGSCHAVNDGIVQAFSSGILTQSTLMAPCPWFEEGAALAKAEAIPVGVHCTINAEWDNLRWGPLTSGGSLTYDDRTFFRSVDEAKERCDPAEAAEEFVAQARRVTGAGLDPIHVDCHMGIVIPSAYVAACEHLAVRFLYPAFEGSFEFASIAFLSSQPSEDAGHAEKLAWLQRWLEGLGPGTHLLISHPGVESAELSALTRGDVPMADALRVSDLSVLTAPETRETVERLGIELTSCDRL